MYGVTNTNIDEVFNYVMTGMHFFHSNDYFIRRRESTNEWKTGGHKYTSRATRIITRTLRKPTSIRSLHLNIDNTFPS